MASTSSRSVQRRFLLPPLTHGLLLLCQQPASLILRVALALNAFKSRSGSQLAETTVCTWFVRAFSAQSRQLRILHVSRIAASTAALRLAFKLTGGRLRERRLYRSHCLFGGIKG